MYDSALALFREALSYRTRVIAKLRSCPKTKVNLRGVPVVCGDVANGWAFFFLPARIFFPWGKRNTEEHLVRLGILLYVDVPKKPRELRMGP